MTDFSGYLDRAERATATVPGRTARTVVIRRTFDAPVDDVWQACTDPARIARWFLPVTGDLRLGGRYQLQDHAGGEILRCEPPKLFRATWEYGTEMSEVEVRLSDEGDGTLFELTHESDPDPEFWARYGPAATGVGWDGMLLGLVLHLEGGMIDDPVAWQASDDGRAFMIRSSELWGAAYAESGASPDEVATIVANASAFYTGTG